MKTHVKVIYSLCILMMIAGLLLTWLGAMFSNSELLGWAGVSFLSSIILFIIGDIEQYKEPPKDNNPYSL
jgi:hypothetical protein